MRYWEHQWLVVWKMEHGGQLQRVSLEVKLISPLNPLRLYVASSHSKESFV